MDAETAAVERLLPGWQALAEEVAQELTTWRTAHPRHVGGDRRGGVRGGTADLAAQPVGERPACPQCGGRLEPRGRQRRTVRPGRQPAVLAVTRSYAVCTACGAGLFPPG